MVGKVGRCRHCKRMMVIRLRGLCGTCANKPRVCEKYAPAKPGRPKGDTLDQDDSADMTEQELDALIEEGLRNKPDWWYEGKREYPAERVRSRKSEGFD